MDASRIVPTVAGLSHHGYYSLPRFDELKRDGTQTPVSARELRIQKHFTERDLERIQELADTTTMDVNIVNMYNYYFQDSITMQKVYYLQNYVNEA
eukprot:4997412-Pyramimonas_sp.AAC.1